MSNLESFLHMCYGPAYVVGSYRYIGGGNVVKFEMMRYNTIDWGLN